MCPRLLNEARALRNRRTFVYALLIQVHGRSRCVLLFLSLSLSHTRARACTHTHTHTNMDIDLCNRKIAEKSNKQSMNQFLSLSLSVSFLDSLVLFFNSQSRLLFFCSCHNSQYTISNYVFFVIHFFSCTRHSFSSFSFKLSKNASHSVK